MTKGGGIKGPGESDMPLEILVVALLDPQITMQDRACYDLPPRQDAAAIAEEADGEQHVENRIFIRYASASAAGATVAAVLQ